MVNLNLRKVLNKEKKKKIGLYLDDINTRQYLAKYSLHPSDCLFPIFWYIFEYSEILISDVLWIEGNKKANRNGGKRGHFESHLG